MGDDRRGARGASSHGALHPAMGVLLLALALLPVRERLGDGARVPLDGDGTSWRVQATIDGRARGNLLLDTGATYCVIAPAIARELGLPETGRFATVETANGPVRALVVRLPSLVLGDTACASDVDAIVHDAVPGLDGVLGLNLLNRYRYGIDPERRFLELQ